MSFIFINTSDCISTSRNFININSQNFDTRILSLSSSTNFLTTRSLTVSSDVFDAGSVLQTRVRRINEKRQILVFSSPTDISDFIPDITITPIRSNSKFLIELYGGRYNLFSAGTAALGYGILTYFYGSINNNPNFVNLGVGNSPVEYLFHNAGSNIQRPHVISYLYEPSVPITSLRVRVFGERNGGTTNNGVWNLDQTALPEPNIPFIFSITEIAT